MGRESEVCPWRVPLTTGHDWDVDGGRVPMERSNLFSRACIPLRKNPPLCASKVQNKCNYPSLDHLVKRRSTGICWRHRDQKVQWISVHLVLTLTRPHLIDCTCDIPLRPLQDTSKHFSVVSEKLCFVFSKVACTTASADCYPRHDDDVGVMRADSLQTAEEV